MTGVALLAEGVGRNHVEHRQKGGETVALLAEGVGRNLPLDQFRGDRLRRPPRGGRG